MWIFSCALCVTEICVHLSRFPRPSLCVAGLVCTCFGSPGLPFASQGLCALILASWSALCIEGFGCTSLGFRGPRAALQGSCGLVLAPPARSLHCGVWVHLFRLTTCPLCSRAYPIVSFLRNYHIILHSGFTSLHSQQQCRRVLFPLLPLRHLLFVDL